jgi:hypothetical protein
MNPALAHQFSPFFDIRWLREIAGVLGIPFVPVIDGALHSSPPSSRMGWVHTDYCSAWFDLSGSRKEELLFANREMCEYFTGRVKHAQAQPKEYVRAATIIYYLCNDGWRTNDGGETGLYNASGMATHAEESRVVPINNTLLAFECSPHSHHRFLTNPRSRRNSLILWLHLPIDQAQARWGKNAHLKKNRK